MNEQSYLNKLNHVQLKAISYIDAPVLVIAGPWTGKTFTLTCRIVNLIKNCNILPENILALTFTRRAGNEMKDRLLAILNENNSKVFINTLHAFCLSILKEQNKTDFFLYNDTDSTLLLNDIIKEKKHGRQNIRNLQLSISNIKNENFLISKKDENIYSQEIVDIYNEYENKLKQASAIDFDDIIIESFKLLKQDEKIKAKYQNKFTHILIDEFQDINFVQYELIKLLAESCKNLFVIGDPDQAIYAFRGANTEIFSKFKNDFPLHKEVSLEINYRSHGNILKASQQIIEQNKNRIKKILRTENEEGVSIEIIDMQTDKAEAEIIIRRIEEMIGGASFFAHDSNWANYNKNENRSFSDFAILYRFQKQGDLFEEVLKKHGMPYQRIIRKISFSNDVGLIEEDTFEYNVEKITLLTVHSAKGLEFPVVFIAGCEDGIIPYLKNKTLNELEEERRLFYVGVTRAKNRLILTYTKKRFIFGELRENGISPFIKDISDELKDVFKDNEIKKKRKINKDKQINLF